MDINKQEPGKEKEFRFIQEKVVPKWRKRGKRFLFLLTGTVVLAVIFGLVARYTFLMSENWLIRLLGLEDTGRTQIEFPSSTPVLPAASPTPTPMPSPTPTPVTEPEQTEPVILEQRIEATAEDYVKMLNDIRKIADQTAKSLVTVTAIESGVDWSDSEYETKTVTSGVIIGENNVDVLILTQLNEVRGATRLTVTFSNQTVADAVLWNYDTDYNVAVLAVALNSLNEATINAMEVAVLGESYLVTAGMPVLALGSPNGYTGSMELGMVTKKGLYTSVVDNRLELFQMDIANHEHAGGVIVDFRGEVIGLISQKLKGDSDIFTAVGISKMKPIIEQLANKTERIYFGVIPEELPKEVLSEAGLDYGIYVSEVNSDSPVFEAGIKRCDIIASIDGTDISSIGALTAVLNGHQPGDTVTVKLKRLVKQTYKDVELQVILKKKEN